ncbi:GTPase HflX [Natrialbaceae archaeon A-CW1-1]
MSRPSSDTAATHSNTTALVVSRDTTTPVSTDEIADLARAAGYTVEEAVTQPDHPDTGSYLGAGRLEELATLATETAIEAVIVDARLTPSQHHAIVDALPDGIAVIDRHRLVLDIFEMGAGARRASLQVELAQLRYDLPRLIATTEEGMLNRVTESGTPVYDVRDRIARLERELASLPDPSEQFRQQRREQGFDLVTIAGYTNAGKSTLLHQLADDLELESTVEHEPDPDGTGDTGSEKHATASVADRLFETLETTTRRSTLGRRPVLLTDTVGYVDDLPHDLVASFSATLSEASAADVVVLVVDGSDPPETLERRLQVSLDVLEEHGVDDDQLLTALNKVDRLTEAEQERRRTLAESYVSTVLPLSARDGTNLEALRTQVVDRLPTERATLELPAGDDAMALVSRAYDRTVVADVTYAGETITLECAGRPDVVERLRAEAASLQR